MDRKKKLIITIAAIAILLSSIIGIGYAYFYADITGNAANVKVTTAKVGDVSYVAVGIDTGATKVLPGWTSGSKNVKVQMSASDVDADYTCVLTFTQRGIDDLYLKVENVTGTSANTDYSNFTQISADSVVLSSGTISGGQKHEINYYLQFKETGLNQTVQMGQSIVAEVTCDITSSLRYSEDIYLVDKLLEDHPTRLTRTNFSSGLTTTNTRTLYTTDNTEDNSTVYYFAGNALDNWVVFGEENLGGNCVYNGQEVVDFQTLQYDGNVFTFEYATESTCDITNVAYINDTESYITNIDQNTFNYALQSYGFTGNYLTGENATWRKKTGFCRYNGFEVIDFASVNLNQKHFMYATADNCNLTNVGVVQGFGYLNTAVYVTNVDETTFNYVVSENGFSGQYYSDQSATFHTGAPKYFWRIIRTNTDLEEGGVRLLYAGSGYLNQDGSIPALSNAYVSEGVYSGTSNISDDPAYVSYMWGYTGSIELARTLQTVHSNTPADILNEWYEENLNKYNSLINPYAIYCNDRSYYTGQNTTLNFLFAAKIFGVGFGGHSAFSYACGRFGDGTNNQINSIFAKSESYNDVFSYSDKFTKYANNSSNQRIGNGSLVYPIALITADEVGYSGIVFSNGNTNYYNWLHYNTSNTSATGNGSWWTMTPLMFGDQEEEVYNEGALVAVVAASDDQDIYSYTGKRNYIRPVISLKEAARVISGNGTSAAPYIIKTN